MESHFQTGTFLLLVAAVVAVVTRRFRLPYSVGLVVAGLVLAFVPFTPHLVLTKELLFTALLPPLLFEAAFQIHWELLRRNSAVIVVLATVGVLFSACITTVGMHFVMNWQWITALAFGILIAATDPVSVIAIFREAKVKGRLLVLIEAESLLNDGTAAVGFSVVLALVAGQQMTALGVIAMLLKNAGGGILCGGAIGLGALVLAGRTDDHLAELMVTTVAAYGSFLLADHFGLSGVLATITAGLILSNVRLKPQGEITTRGRESVLIFWEYAAFVSNSLIFLLIGISQAHENFAAIWLPVIAAIVFVMLGRAAAVYPCCLAFSRSSMRVALKHQHILLWGGLRGALALALALSLPPELPMRNEVRTATFAVVAFSVFVQGLTMMPFLRKMGELPESEFH
jgi:monovalent cation:H+ antiporter, CPA1 family